MSPRFFPKARDMASALTTLALLTLSRILLRARPLPMVLRQFRKEAAHPARWDRERVRREALLLNQLEILLSATPLRILCWQRALMLQRVLAMGGIGSRIVLGVRSSATREVLGHAWVEHEGRPVLERPSPRFARLYSFP